MAASLALKGAVATAPSAARAPERILSIDWLRGAAALAVFVFHVANQAGFDKRALPPFTLAGRTFTNILSPLSLGASGVNLFFILSGFCLSLQQRGRGREQLSGPDLRAYFQGRFARIVPAYWAAILLSALAMALFSAMPPRALLSHAALHIFFLHGLDRTAFLSLNPALWSMATEVEFYLVFPWLFRLHARLGGAWFVIGTGLFTLAYRVIVAFYPFAPTEGSGVSSSALLAYQLPGRLWEFALGMYLAEVFLRLDPRARRLFRVLWLPALPFALYGRGFGPPYLPDIALGAFYAALLGRVLIARPRLDTSPLRSALSAWGARFGRSSYSFFLVHAPILLALSSLLPGSPEHPYRQFFFLFCAGLPLSVGAAAALYLGVELPLWRRLRA